MPNPSLFLFAGEKSGDLIGGKLVRALTEQMPQLTCFGVGGGEMQAAGMALSHPMDRFQVMGFIDVFKALPRLYVDFKKIKKEILQKNPQAVVLIDYPDFNIRLAHALRKEGYRGKIIHYVCPTVWAWRKNRIYTLARTLDHLLTILPFEKACFNDTTLPVTYVGHPLVASIDNYHYVMNTLHFEKPVIALFPGSRKHEIELNLPLQLAAAAKLLDQYSLAISVASPHLLSTIQKYTKNYPVCLVGSSQRYELMKLASAALATSGSVILELGLHAVPTAVTYQLGVINAFFAKYIFRIRLPHYTLVNIICGETIYPEFIHKFLSPEKIYQGLRHLLDNPQPCQEGCRRLRTLLETRDASQEAAQIIIQHLL